LISEINQKFYPNATPIKGLTFTDNGINNTRLTTNLAAFTLALSRGRGNKTVSSPLSHGRGVGGEGENAGVSGMSGI